MPIVNIEYDANVVQESEIRSLSEATHKIVSETTQIEDVPIYANSAKVMVKAAPIEIFIRMSAHKVKDTGKLVESIKAGLLPLYRWIGT